MSGAIRPRVRRILDDLASDDVDIMTYAAMNVMRLKELGEQELAALAEGLRRVAGHECISVRFFARKALNEVKLQLAKRRPGGLQDRSAPDVDGANWPELLASLEKESTDRKLQILDLLCDVDDPLLVEPLCEYLEREEDLFAVAAAIRALGCVGEQSVLDFLEGYLSHEDPRVRSNAIEAMEKIGGKTVMRSILPLLEDDDNRVRATVAKLVGKYGEHNVINTLAGMVRSVELWMRVSAAYALGFVPYEEAVDLLMEALCDANTDVQRKAVESLGRLGAARARDLLRVLSGNADSSLASAASKALRQVNEKMKTYPYFDPRNKKNVDFLSRVKVRKGAHALRGGGGRGAVAAHADAPSAASAAPSDDAGGGMGLEQRAALEGSLRAMKVEMGQMVLQMYRAGELKHPGLKELSTEEKKLRYLISQKEAQIKELQEENTEASFVDFIRRSVSFFSTEQQVDRRMEHLIHRLDDVYAAIAEKVLPMALQDEDLCFRLKDLPRKIAALGKRLGSSAGTG